MPALPKIFVNKTVVALTSSMEEGLYLPPNSLMRAIVEGQLARAQHLHPVRINHFLFESNHFHMLVTVDNPDDIPHFMERFKTETAHAVNRLMGRRKRTVWCKGYDSPVILTLEDVIDRIVYTYTNPAKDGLERCIEKYPGVSSFGAWQTKRTMKRCSWITRSMLRPLSSHNLTEKQYRGLAEHLKAKSIDSHILEVFPDVWMEAFGISSQQECKAINGEILRRIKAREVGYELERKRRGRRVVGSERLVEEPMDKEYTPSNRQGRKMWCICRDVELRKNFITEAKHRVRQARKIYQRWKVGDFSEDFPAGLFPPRMPKRVEALRFI